MWLYKALAELIRAHSDLRIINIILFKNGLEYVDVLVESLDLDPVAVT